MKKFILSIILLISAGTQCLGMQRYYFNELQLYQLRQFSDKNHKNIVLVTDLHDVFLDRTSGDLNRAWQLSWPQLGRFVGKMCLFGPKFLASKITDNVERPHIELYALDKQPVEQQEKILEIISPFTVNELMFKFFRGCGYPVFACSNVGQASYDYMNKKSGGKFNIFAGAQIATECNGYIQKNNPKTFICLVDLIKEKTGKMPDAIFMIDDRYKNIERCTKTLEPLGIRVFGYIFSDAKTFISDVRRAFDPRWQLAVASPVAQPTTQKA